jgi:methionyl aminopeptidase
VRVYLKSTEEIDKLRKANQAVRKTLDEIEAHVKPGVSTWELNDVADRTLKKLGATSAFLGYHGYPAVLCTSRNQVVVHGIPRKDDVLEEGDIVGIDFGCFVDGFCGDSARTLPVGKVKPEATALMDATKKSLELGIAACKDGNRIGDIGWAVQSYVEPLGYSVVRTFVGHGIGRAMHEDPQVPNYGSPGRGLRLKPGMVLAIEPMVNAGQPEVRTLDDHWTAVTVDGSLSAHFEHSIAITENGPEVLSRVS